MPIILEGLTATEVRFAERATAIDVKAPLATLAAANVVKAAVSLAASRIHRSGKANRRPLSESIDTSPIPFGYEVGSTSPLAHLVIKGHAAPQSLITPQNAQALSWSGQGSPIFAASSPGGTAHGQDFMKLEPTTRAEAVTAAREVIAS